MKELGEDPSQILRRKSSWGSGSESSFSANLSTHARSPQLSRKMMPRPSNSKNLPTRDESTFSSSDKISLPMHTRGPLKNQTRNTSIGEYSSSSSYSEYLSSSHGGSHEVETYKNRSSSRNSTNNRAVNGKSSGERITTGKIENGNQTKQNQIIREMGTAVKDQDYGELMRLMESDQQHLDSIKVGLFLLCCGAYREHENNENPQLFGTDSWAKSLVTVTKDKFENKDIQELAVSTLSAMCHLSEVYMHDIVQHGGVKLVCSIAKEYRENSSIVGACCCAIFYMIDRTVRKNQNPLRRSGLVLRGEVGIKTVESLVFILTLSIPPETKSWILDAIINFALQEIPAEDGRSLSKLVRDAENGQGLRMFISAVNIDIYSSRLFCSAFNLLNIFSAESVLATSEDLMKTVTAMIKRVDDEKGLVAAFSLLGRLTFDSAALSGEMFSTLINLISSSLNNYRNGITLQIATIKAAINLLSSCNGRGEFLDLRTLILAVIEAMITFEENVELQRYGGHALVIIASVNEDCKMYIVNNGGVLALSKAVRNNSEISEIANELKCLCCALFLILMRRPDNLPSQAKNDIISFLLGILHSKKIELTDSVKNGIQNIIINNCTEQLSECATFMVDSVMKAVTAEDVETSMNNIGKLCKRSPNLMKSLIVANAGQGVERVVELMINHSNMPTVSEAGCQMFAAIFTLFPFQGNVEEKTNLEFGCGNFSISLHSIKYIRVIRQALSSFHAKPSVVVNAMIALGTFLLGPSTSLHFDDEVRKIFLKSLGECIDIIQMHQDDLDTLNICIWYLRCIVSMDDIAEIKSYGSMLHEKLLNLLNTQSDDALKMNICCAVLSLIQKDIDSISSIGHKKFINFMLSCLRSEAREIIVLSSELLAAILTQVVTFVGDIIEAPNSIETIVNCMNRNMRVSEIISNCCSILESIATLNDSDYVISTIIKKGGYDAILSAFDHHMKNEGVATNAGKALLGIVKEASIIEFDCQRIAESTIRIMSESTESAEVMSPLLELIWFLCSLEPNCIEYFSNNDVILYIIDCMKHHLPDRSLQGAACVALWSLAPYNNNKNVIGANDGLRCITNSLLAHIESFRIQKEALTALKNLATTSDNKKRIISCCGEEAIVLSMRLHIHSEEILTSAFAALNNIAVDIHTREVAPAPAAAFEIIVLAMKRFPDSKSVQKNACFLLKSYSFSDENLFKMQECSEDLLSVLPIASSNFPEECSNNVQNIFERLF